MPDMTVFPASGSPYTVELVAGEFVKKALAKCHALTRKKWPTVPETPKVGNVQQRATSDADAVVGRDHPIHP